MPWQSREQSRVSGEGGQGRSRNSNRVCLERLRGALCPSVSSLGPRAPGCQGSLAGKT